MKNIEKNHNFHSDDKERSKNHSWDWQNEVIYESLKEMAWKLEAEAY